MEAHSDQHVVATLAPLKCSVCKELLPAENFYVVRGRSNGKRDSSGTVHSSRCKDCQINDYLKLDPRKRLLYAARKRAKQSGLDCTWDEYCEASLDLSNQDNVGEAGAIAALDKLYANNNEGMKRLADS
jgi:hypothetical protein